MPSNLPQPDAAQLQLFIVPVCPDGSVDAAEMVMGELLSVAEDRLIFTLTSSAGLPADLLVGVRGAEGYSRCAGVTIRSIHLRDDGRVCVSTLAGGLGAGLLDPDNLAPMFNAETLRLEYPVAQSTLDDCEAIGALTKRVADQVKLCPQCRAIPTFRDGCKQCGSVRRESDELIHHYACAHVGPASDFERDGGLACPKCRATRLIVGADFEYLEGQSRCVDCGWSDSSLVSIGHCLKCDHRFPAAEAAVDDIYVYSPNLWQWPQWSL